MSHDSIGKGARARDREIFGTGQLPDARDRVELVRHQSKREGGDAKPARGAVVPIMAGAPAMALIHEMPPGVTSKVKGLGFDALGSSIVTRNLRPATWRRWDS